MKYKKEDYKNYVESPHITVNDDELIIHNYINLKGKMVLDRQKASLLYLELYKFLLTNR